MTETQLRERFARQRPSTLPDADWGDVLHRAGRGELAPERSTSASHRWNPLGGWGGRRMVVVALAATVALMTLAAAALAYRYFSEPVSPGFRLYLNKLASDRIRFDPTEARLQVGAAVPQGNVLLWTAPSEQHPGSLVWGFQAQIPSTGPELQAAEVRDLGAACCGETTGMLNDWGGQALSQTAGKQLWLEAGHAGVQAVRVAVKYQDGSSADAQLQHGFFLATIGAEHYRTGLRPVALIAYDDSGAIIGQAMIDPSGFQGSPSGSVDLHPLARGREFTSFPLLVGGAGQIWLSKGTTGSYSWTFVIDRHDQLLGGGFAALKDNPSNRHAVILTGLRYQARGRHEIVYGGDTWQIHSLTWVHPNGTRTPVPIQTTPTRVWPYVGNLVIIQTPGWKPARGILIARDHRGRVADRIDLSKVILEPND